MIKAIKHSRWLFVFIIFLSAISCEKESFNCLGFDSPFSKKSKGLVLISVDKGSDSIFLEGEILVEEGGVEVQLINPGNETVYFILFESAGMNQISKIILADKGIWKLKYTSINGTGTIDLHANF